VLQRTVGAAGGGGADIWSFADLGVSPTFGVSQCAHSVVEH
jgi:hypothetical protein